MGQDRTNYMLSRCILFRRALDIDTARISAAIGFITEVKNFGIDYSLSGYLRTPALRLLDSCTPSVVFECHCRSLSPSG